MHPDRRSEEEGAKVCKAAIHPGGDGTKFAYYFEERDRSWKKRPSQSRTEEPWFGVIGEYPVAGRKAGWFYRALRQVELTDDGGGRSAYLLADPLQAYSDDCSVHTDERAAPLRGTCFHLDRPNLDRSPQPVRTSSAADGQYHGKRGDV
jgi:hypothetical protein